MGLLLGLPTLALPLTLCVFLERWLEFKRPTTLARLERVEGEPAFDVNRLIFSPDGQTVAAVVGKNIRVWRCGPDGVTHLATLEGHTDTVRALAFSPDGKTLASCSVDSLIGPKFRTIQGWWGPVTMPRIKMPRIKMPRIKLIKFPESLTFTLVESERPEDGEPDHGEPDHTIRLWEIGEGGARETAVLRSHGAPVNAVAFMPDGRALVSVGDDRTVRLWDLTGAAPKERFARAGSDRTWPSLSAAFSPDGRWLAETATAAPDVVLWDLGGPAPVRQAVLAGPDPGHHTALARAAQTVSGLLFAPDGNRLAAVNLGGGVRLWDLAGPAPARGFVLKEAGELQEKSRSSIHDLAFGPGGKALAVVHRLTGKVELWDLRRSQPARQELPTGTTSVFGNLAFSPDGEALAIGGVGEKDAVQLWDVSGGKAVKKAELPSKGNRVPFVLFSPDGRSLIVWTAVDGLKNVRRWDVSGAQPRLTEERPHPAGKGRFSVWADGQRLAVVREAEGDADTVELWSAGGEKLGECRLGAWERFLLAPDGRHLAVVSEHTVSILRLWGSDAADRLFASCQEVLKRDPRSVAALVGRGRAHLAKGRVEEALSDAAAALAVDGRSTDASLLRARALYQRGLARADRGQYAEARADLAEAVRLDPSLAPPAKTPRRRSGGGRVQ
jgi:WD40 repeat protein